MLAIRLAALVMNLRSSWSISETTNEIHLHFRETLGKALCKTDEEINCIKMMWDDLDACNMALLGRSPLCLCKLVC